MRTVLCLVVAWILCIHECFAEEALLVIGGFAYDIGEVDTVDIITEDLKVISGPIPNAPRPGSGLTAQVVGNEVLVCGGIKACMHLNLTTRSWKYGSRLQEFRVRAASVTYDGTMNIFGGSFLASVERYNPLSNSWAIIPEWELPEDTSRFCAVQHQDYIYEMGGLVSGDQSVMRRLSTINNVYEPMPSMLVWRRSHACIITSIGDEDGILVTGGEWPPHRSTEFFSFESQKWRFLANMNIAHSGHGIGILNGRPVVFGGRDIIQTNSLEVYDSANDKWTMVDGATLTQPKAEFAYVKIPWQEA